MSNKIRTFALVRGMFNASRSRGKDRIMLGRMTYIIRLRVLACASLLCSLLCDAQSVLTLRVGNALPNVLDGMGVELDPHFLPQNVTANNGTRAEDWDSVVLRRLRLLRPAKLRVMILPEWYEPQNDDASPLTTDTARFHFDGPEMQSLYRVLDFAQAEGMRVTLTFWGTRTGTFLHPQPVPGWMFGPTEHDEWAENLSVCLHHLLHVKGYRCIHEVTPVNEPDWSFHSATRDQAKQYIHMCLRLGERLRRDSLSSEVHLSLSDNSDGGSHTRAFLAACCDSLSREAELFNSHTYVFGYETPNSRILDWERQNVALCARVGKRHFIGEFGSNQTVGATVQRDIDRYERGLLMARVVINLLNAGATGASYWSLLDQYYSRGEALARRNMQRLGLWRYLKREYEGDSIYAHLSRDYEVRPQYFALGMIYHAVLPGSRVFPMETGSEWVAATALCDSLGRWSYLLVNPTETDQPVMLEHPRNRSSKAQPHVGRATLWKYVYREDALPQDDAMVVASDSLRMCRGLVRLTLPRRSFIVLSYSPTFSTKPS